MLLHDAQLIRLPGVFPAMTGLTRAPFDVVSTVVRPDRQRVIGGTSFTCSARDQMLRTIVWLRRSPTDAVLGSLFGVSATITLRTPHRRVPLLDAAGLVTMRLPDPGRNRRPHWAARLRGPPADCVVLPGAGRLPSSLTAHVISYFLISACF